MGARGPKPTPTKVLEARGSWRAKKRGDGKLYEPAVPPCPASLKGEARSEWDRITQELHRARLLTKVDRATLALYCQVWARWVKAEEMLATTGEILKSAETGNLYQNPYLSVANKAVEQLSRLCAEFGLSPAARTRLAAPQEDGDEEDPLEKFLRDGGSDN